MDRCRRALLALGRALALLLVAGWVASPALAHGGALGGAARESMTVPTWLVVGTGGAVVGASFLLAGFVTDRSFLAALHAPKDWVSLPGERALRAGANVLGVLTLVSIVVVGLVGPADPLSNAAIVVVWAGWWAGFAMSTYLVGNTWPALNPWRTIARAVPTVGRTYRWRWGAWPSVAGLLALVWLEVVSPLAAEPQILAVTVVAYSAVTVSGALVYGTDKWFRTVDPVSRVFRLYGQVAPVGRWTGGRYAADDAESGPSPTVEPLVLRLPGGALTEDVLTGRDDVAFVVALLWVTTYDGFVTTPLWRSLADALVGAGVPPVALYPGALLAGFTLFLGLYLLAARLARRTAPTFVDAPTLARRFAPPLLAIAAGYHLAHFLGYFLGLSPALVLAVTKPLATVDPQLLVFPGWFGAIAMASILAGHLLAVLAAHATAFELFPGRLQAIRSQYPFVAVMIGYTIVSLWIVTRPDVLPPYLIRP